MQPKKPMTQVEKNKEKFRLIKEKNNQRKEAQIDAMGTEDVMAQLKKKALPTFGTAQERKDRLKKYNGRKRGKARYPGERVATAQPVQLQHALRALLVKKSSVVDKVEEMRLKREERRKKMEEEKMNKLRRNAENQAEGRSVDVDFDLMVDRHRLDPNSMKHHVSAQNLKICVCVRKRPIFPKESHMGEIDIISAANPNILVHECKVKVDGITKYIEDHPYKFDNTFHENEQTIAVYESTIKPLIKYLFNKGVVTCFAYGQTGSGKTYTMEGVQAAAIQDLFYYGQSYPGNIYFQLSFFEIYGGKLFDLLNNKNKLQVLEDHNQKIQIHGLENRYVGSSEEAQEVIRYGNSVRTTHCTAANDTSSRSHAICTITITDSGRRNLGKLILVDLAGSERAQDTQSNNRQRRLEGAQINKSLLALKECVCALDAKNRGVPGVHVPFRASKLTMVLRDSFLSKSNRIRIIMISCVCPGHNSADHTNNTLRYARRLKENPGNVDLAGDSGIVDYASEDNNVLQKKPSNFEAPSKKALADAGKMIMGIPNRGPPRPPMHPAQKISGPRSGNLPPSKLMKQESQSKIEESASDDDQGDTQEENKAPSVPLNKNYVKTLQKQDWAYLKKTINHKEAEEFLNFQEKAEDILEEEEELVQVHLDCVKEDAQMLTKESQIVSEVQQRVEDYDMDTYIQDLETLVTRKVQLYSNLLGKIKELKKHLKEEEEASQKQLSRGVFY